MLKKDLVCRILTYLACYHAYVATHASTGTVYIKFRDNAHYGIIRISDHKTKNSNRWNFIDSIEEPYNCFEHGLDRYYYGYGEEHFDLFLDEFKTHVGKMDKMLNWQCASLL